ncbi:MAG: YybH family protein [Gemmatimonadota bacterium]
MLHASAEAWTRGDLEGYLDGYAPDATFVGASGLTRGRDRIREAYREGYWSSGTPRDGLRFRLLDVRAVGPGTALAVGRYILYDRDTGDPTATGLFSLTLRNTPEGWRIVHDHSSADDGPTG